MLHIKKLIHPKYTWERQHITMTSWWAQWRLKSPASRLFNQLYIRAQIKENIKAPRHCPLCRELSPVNSSHKWPATRKMFPFDVVIMKIELYTITTEAIALSSDYILPNPNVCVTITNTKIHSCCYHLMWLCTFWWKAYLVWTYIGTERVIEIDLVSAYKDMTKRAPNMIKITGLKVIECHYLTVCFI